MRVSVALALCCLCTLSFAADPAHASIRKDLNVPAEELGSALQTVAKDYDFQVLYRTEIVKDLRTQGAVGSLTSDEALGKVLKGTGLTYKYLDSNTVTIMPAPGGATAGASDQSPSDSTNGGGKKSSQDFRVAQVDQGKNANTAAVGNQSSTPQQNASGQSAGLEEIVVTAQKRSERMQDVPMSVSVLSGKELETSTFSGVTDALNSVPGVSAFAQQFQAGGTQLSFRGVSAGQAFGGGASTVGYYVDSVPFGMIRSALVPDPNVYDLDRIEILRGPQGTLYGANALNGVVRVLTNDADVDQFDFKARSSVSTTEGGGANYGGDMAVNLPIIEGKLAARVVVGDTHESGWIDGPLGSNRNKGDLGDERVKIRWKATDELTVDLSAWHSQQDFDALAIATDSGRSLATSPEPAYTQFNAYGAKIDYDLPIVSISSMTSYVAYTNNNQLDANPAIPGINIGTNFKSRVVSEEIDMTSKLDAPWKWTAGLMYRDDKDIGNQPGYQYPNPTPVTIYDNQADTSKSAAVYGELGRKFFDDKILATVGLRYFHDDEGNMPLELLPAYGVNSLAERKATSSATTPRASLTWTPSRELTAYVSYSQGFRSGMPQDELVGAAIPDYPPLKPDKLTNYEAGIKGTLWNQRVSYEAAIFHIKWQDIQQVLPILTPQGGYDTVLLNSNTASGNGAEFALKLQPVDGLLLSTDFGWNDLHFTSNVVSAGAVIFPEGSRPNDSPKLTASAAAEYQFPLGSSGLHGALSISGNYISPLNITYLTAGSFEANSLFLTRGSFAIRFPKNWEVKAFVDNANNYDGTQYRVLGLEQWSARERPRTYGLGVNYHLK